VWWGCGGVALVLRWCCGGFCGGVIVQNCLRQSADLPRIAWREKKKGAFRIYWRNKQKTPPKLISRHLLHHSGVETHL